MIVNGGQKTWFCGHRGVRQEDPLSHLLFTLVVDVRSCLISRTVVSGLNGGVKVGSKGIVVSYLQFVDNTILFVENDKDNFLSAKMIRTIF